MFSAGLCEGVWAPYALSVTTATCAAVLCVATVPGNALICWAIIRDPYKELKSSFNYFVLNLAMADLFIGAVTEPVFVWYHASEALHHEVLALRWLVYTSYFMTCAASVLSIAALSFDRHLTITSTYRRTLQPSRAIAVSVAIWALSLSVPALHFVTGFYAFAFIFANTALVVTIAVLVFSIVRIHRRLRTHLAQVGATFDRRHHQRRVLTERKVTKYFLFILVSFICCSVPSCAMIYVINLCDNCSCQLIHWFRDFQYLMILFNSSTNQFLYAWRMPAFQKILRRKFQPLLPCWRLSATSEANADGDIVL